MKKNLIKCSMCGKEKEPYIIKIAGKEIPADYCVDCKHWLDRLDWD